MEPFIVAVIFSVVIIVFASVAYRAFVKPASRRRDNDGGTSAGLGYSHNSHRDKDDDHDSDGVDGGGGD
jgi:hypothetical protein